MTPPPDRRLWSTTPRRLSAFVGALLETGIPSAPVRTLHRAFREHKFYPARDLPQFCVPEPPDVFFSYHSSQNFVDIQEIVWRAGDYAARLLARGRPDLTAADLEPLIADGVRLWVDFMFIDQAARDLRTELEALPVLLRGAGAHFVLGTQPLTRAWCCYEIALYNRHLTRADESDFPAGVRAPVLRSYVAPSRSFYTGWDRAETTEADDKTFIAERIRSSFPGGFDGFDAVMAQANTLAVLPLTEGTTWATPAADENLLRAAETWYRRWLGRGP